MADATIQQVNEAVGELRTLVESKSKETSEYKEKFEKINAFLDAQEEKNQQALIAQKNSEKSEEEFKERIDVLEKELARKISTPGEGKSYREAEEYKALQSALTKGENGVSVEEKALLRTDSDTAGGYLVQGEFDNQITKKITEISGIRSIARVRTISAKSLEIPRRDAILTAEYEGEAEQDTESVSAYGSDTITPFRLSVNVPSTMDLLMDASFDMETEIFSDAAESFAQKEGNKFVLGTGVKQPEGFTTNATIQAGERESSTSATITADDVILLTGDLKTGYDPTYVMNRKTLAFLRTLKSTDGVFLWQPGMNGPVANTINGFPYILAQDMADIAANSRSIAFGDFRRGYTIIDRTGVSVVRDDVTRKREAIVEFNIRRWNTGQVTLPEAITMLRTKA